MFDDHRVTVDGRLVGPNFILSANETVELKVHMHEPEVCRNKYKAECNGNIECIP